MKRASSGEVPGVTDAKQRAGRGPHEEDDEGHKAARGTAHTQEQLAERWPLQAVVECWPSFMMNQKCLNLKFA